MDADNQTLELDKNAPRRSMERLVVPLSDAQRYLITRLPESGEWVRVPPAVRSSTICSLVTKGLIDHKKNIAEYWDEWLTMGWVRIRHNVKCAPTGAIERMLN